MLTAAFVVALASMFIVPPDSAYLTYFDWETIGCLFCVLAVANAFRRIGMFDRIARSAVERNHRARTLALVIVLVTALFSMLLTNDVALIIMLPLSAAMLVELNQPRLVPIVFALQTLAANLCGMIAPFGSPQNIYLYSCYQLEPREFLSVMTGPFLLSLAGIIITTLVMAKEKKVPEPLSPEHKRPAMPIDSRRSRLYMILFAITLLAIFRIIPFIAAALLIAISVGISDRKALREVDYGLLVTFLLFFIFAGNVSRIPELGEMLGSLMEQWGLLTSALVSQVISNVPAAVILSHFTDSWQQLLIGVNIGGAGTFIGSLASLIAIRYFGLSRKVFPVLRASDAPTMGYFLVRFGVLNIAFFVVLLVICQIIFG